MQRRPSPEELLAAIEQFLTRELQPAIADRALRFRALIAANLVGQVRAGLAGAADRAAAEHAGLRALLGRTGGDGVPLDDERDTDLERALAAGLRAGSFDQRLDEVRRHLMEVVGRTISTHNPRFDLGRNIE